jgi:hypothetical protein
MTNRTSATSPIYESGSSDMDGLGLIFFGLISMLCCSGWIYPEIGSPYRYPQAKARQGEPVLRTIVVPLRFWTSGFV